MKINIMESRKLYLAEAFMVAGTFIGVKYFESFSEEIDILQSKFFVINTDEEDWKVKPISWDPSAWNDWMHASKEVLQKKVIDLSIDKVDLMQAYLIMKEFVRAFAYEYDFKDLVQLSEEINQDQREYFKDSKQWKQWLFCVQAMISHFITNQGFLYKLDNAIFTEQQAYKIMQRFLLNFCLYKQHMKEVATLLKSDFYSEWKRIYEQISNEKVTLYQAYKVMQLFLQQWGEKHLDQQVYLIFIEKFQIKDNGKPVNSEFSEYWIREANEVLMNIK